MAVTANRTGNNATVTITFDITDILALVGVSNAEKKQRSFQRAQSQLGAAIEAAQFTDTVLDQRAADAAAAVAALKAARPTGNL